MDTEFWNKRYAEHTTVYGTAPNAFLKEFLQGRSVGKVLFPAEGEGRNAVYAASLGWEVHAFDQSDVARDKAIAAAEATGVELEYTLSDLSTWVPTDNYDLVGVFYVHLPTAIRQSVMQNLVAALKPGGIWVMEVFSKEQMAFDSGGPKDRSMLFDLDMLAEDLSGLEELSMEQFVVQLDEGPFHKGPASVIRVEGRKAF
jgi:hypothetical protein